MSQYQRNYSEFKDYKNLTCPLQKEKENLTCLASYMKKRVLEYGNVKWYTINDFDTMLKLTEDDKMILKEKVEIRVLYNEHSLTWRHMFIAKSL